MADNDFMDDFLFPGLAESETQKHLAGGKFAHDQSTHGMRYSGARSSSTRVFQSMSTEAQKKYLAGLEKRGDKRMVNMLKPYHEARLAGKSPQLKLDPKNPYKGSPQDKRRQATELRRAKKTAFDNFHKQAEKLVGREKADYMTNVLRGKSRPAMPESFAKAARTFIRMFGDQGHLTPGEFSVLADILEDVAKLPPKPIKLGR